jgi:hypothetical protein
MSRLYFSMNLFDDGRFHSELLLAVGGAPCGTQKQPGAAMR